MPTTYNDQFWIIDPYSPPATGTVLTVQKFDLVDADDDGDIGRGGADSINGVDVSRSYPGDTVTVQNDDGSTSTITGTTFYLADGTRVFTPSDGSVLEDLPLVSTTWVSASGDMSVDDLGPPCLVKGTLVKTQDGDVKVEDLRDGMTLLGEDGRALVLRMILHTTIDARDLERNPKLAPIRIVAGALGQGLPRRDLLVSRQHRMVVSAPVVAQMFDNDEVLVPAAKLLPLPGIYVDTSLKDVTYFHLVFDDHEIIYAEGAPTESLFTGPEALASVSDEAREELLALFPELAKNLDAMIPARSIPKDIRQKKLVARLERNSKAPLARNI